MCPGVLHLDLGTLGFSLGLALPQHPLTTARSEEDTASCCSRALCVGCLVLGAIGSSTTRSVPSLSQHSMYKFPQSILAHCINLV